MFKKCQVFTDHPLLYVQKIAVTTGRDLSRLRMRKDKSRRVCGVQMTHITERDRRVVTVTDDRCSNTNSNT